MLLLAAPAKHPRRPQAKSILLPPALAGLGDLLTLLRLSPVVLNPTPEHRREEASKNFEEGEVYGVDVLITSSTDGKARTEEARTTIYKKTDISYQLKMKTSRTVFAEIQKKVRRRLLAHGGA